MPHALPISLLGGIRAQLSAGYRFPAHTGCHLPTVLYTMTQPVSSWILLSRLFLGLLFVLAIANLYQLSKEPAFQLLSCLPSFLLLWGNSLPSLVVSVALWQVSFVDKKFPQTLNSGYLYSVFRKEDEFINHSSKEKKQHKKNHWINRRNIKLPCRNIVKQILHR